MWSETVARYIREGRPVSGGCGPSNALKAINKNIQQFATTVQSEAGDVFDASSSVFHNIMNAVTGIVKGGPSQYGFSAGEQSAKMAAATEAGATEARNLKAVAAGAAGSIGGGNVAMPGGAGAAAIMSAEQKAASDTAMAKNEITQQGFEKGYDEWKTGLSAMQKAPDVFNASTAANQGVTAAQHEAETSQTNIDQMSNWAMNDIMKLGTSFVGGLGSSLGSGGFSNLFKGNPASAPTSVGSPG